MNQVSTFQVKIQMGVKYLKKLKLEWLICLFQLSFTQFFSTAHYELCTRFDVKGYPTIMYISDGTTYRFKNKRMKEALIDFVERDYVNAEV